MSSPNGSCFRNLSPCHCHSPGFICKSGWLHNCKYPSLSPHVERRATPRPRLSTIKLLKDQHRSGRVTVDLLGSNPGQRASGRRGKPHKGFDMIIVLTINAFFSSRINGQPSHSHLLGTGERQSRPTTSPHPLSVQATLRNYGRPSLQLSLRLPWP
jgi:hypothetical protein